MVKIKDDLSVNSDAKIVVHHISLFEIIQAEKSLEIGLV